MKEERQSSRPFSPSRLPLHSVFFFSRETPEYKVGSQSVRTRNDHQGRSALITKQLQINSMLQAGEGAEYVTDFPRQVPIKYQSSAI